MKSLIIVFGIMSTNLFFAIMAIMGMEYEGASESNIYVVYSVVIAGMIIGIVCKDILRKKLTVTKKEILLLIFIPFFIIINLLSTKIITGRITGFSVNYYFKYFFLWSYVGLLAGFYVNKKNQFKDIERYIDIVIVVFTIGIIKAGISQLAGSENFTGIGGSTYQSLSYIAALAFGLNLQMIIQGHKYKRFSVFNKTIYKQLSVIMLVVQLVCVLLSGGRGGIVLIVVYIVYHFKNTITFKNINIEKLKIIVGVGVILIITLPILLNNEMFLEGVNRVFGFIDKNGLNWEGTSGRDVVYTENIQIIKENFIFGKGLFLTEINPHNLFLELLINGGVVYLITCIGILIFILNKLRKIVKGYPEKEILIVILLYPATMLMFSGTYGTNSELWFVLGATLFYKLDENTGKFEESNEKNRYISK